MLSLTNLSNLEATLLKLLKYSGINADVDIILDELGKHPDFPSLLAVSDVLTALKIENAAFRNSFEELENIPCPFIAYTHQSGGEILVVNKMERDNFFVSNQKWSKHKLKSETFKKIYADVVLLTQPSTPEMSLRKSFIDFLFKIKTYAALMGILSILLVAVLFLTPYCSNLSWETFLLTVAKTAGLIICVLLLIQSIDKNNPLIQVLCGGEGKINCNTIISSKAAQVFEGLSWSEVGFFYFMGTWLLLLFGDGSAPIRQVLALLNFISLPYTFYSIYYQAKIAKQWCILCCTIQAILWLEFVIFIVNFDSLRTFDRTGSSLKLLSELFVCLLCPIILWALLKPIFLKLNQLKPLKEQLHKFKYNVELFNKLLKDQPKLAPPNEDWSIVLGNPNAPNVITMVSNLYCNPCALTHKLIADWLKSSNNIQARIVFTASNNEKDKRREIAAHMMSLDATGDKKKIENGLSDWYNQKNYRQWAKKYPVAIDVNVSLKLQKQIDWCKVAEIKGTPTIFVNGFLLPGIYRINDLKYMLEY